MAKDKVYPTDCSDNLPEWYWTRGLHDACIVGVEMFEFPFDYNKFVREKSNYNRSLAILKINANSALYDNTVTEIRFFNYEILTDNISLEGRKEIWWLSDRLADHGDYYTLEIDLKDLNSYPEDFTFKIKFEHAEVDRK